MGGKNMSTKIYNGARLKHMSMIELNDYIKDLRKRMLPSAQEEFNKVFANLFESLVVNVQTGIQMPTNTGFNYSDLKGKTYEDVLLCAIKETRRVIKKNEKAETIMEYEPDFDFAFKLYVFPIKRKLLAIPLVENAVLHKCFFSDPNVTQYGYWNNSDRPDEISRDAWNRRKNNWDLALPGMGMILDMNVLRCNLSECSS
jgi:hypothetical protein